MADANQSSEPIHSEFSDDPEMSELIDYFVREMPDRAMSLCEAWRDGRMDDLRTIAHQMKGAGPGFGFLEIGEVAARLEDAIDQQSELDSIREELDALVDLCRRVTI